MRTQVMALGLAALALLVGVGITLLGTLGDSAASSRTVSASGDDGDFSVMVCLEGAEDFDAGQFDVSFDPSVLQLDHVAPGNLGDTQIPVSLWTAVNATTYRILVNVPGVPGISGSGSLAVLHFHAINNAGGPKDITLSAEFANNNLAEGIDAVFLLRPVAPGSFS